MCPRTRPERGPGADLTSVASFPSSARRGSAARWSLDAIAHACAWRSLQGGNHRSSVAGRGDQRRRRPGRRREPNARDGARCVTSRSQCAPEEGRLIPIARWRGRPLDSDIRGFQRRRRGQSRGTAVVTEGSETRGVCRAAQGPQREHDTRKYRCAKHPGHHRPAVLWIRVTVAGKPRAGQDCATTKKTTLAYTGRGLRFHAYNPRRAISFPRGIRSLSVSSLSRFVATVFSRT
jgi:hypothetical protein